MMNVERLHTPIPGQPLIELRGVSRRFEKRTERHRSLQELFIRLFQRSSIQVDEFWPLKDVSLSIHAGDSLGVIGPNGSGKSTLLKLITGILQPTEGELCVRGRLSSLLELGAGFQPDLTGRENIYLNGSIYGLSRSEMNRRLPDIIRYAELGEFIDTPVKHYSSGMYVRLGFAIAIHTQPDILLVDEVLAVGDVSFQHKCLNSIYQFRKNGGTLVLVSHDMTAIQNICNRAIWIEDGRIQAEGKPTDVVMAYLESMATREEEAQNQAEAPKADSGPGQRWGNGKIQITQVELCGDDGTPRSVFVTGEPLQIRLHYRSREPIQAPIFGVALHHENGVHIAGPNTRFSGVHIPQVEREGIVTYRIPRLPLLEGTYTVSVAVVNETDTEIFDYHDRRYPFRVFPGRRRDGYGLISLEGAWEVSTGTSAWPTASVEEPLHTLADSAAHSRSSH
ncbi:ABC transporter ATP-binding protein [Litorilinea aerophila]|uniref:ABC transporter ATP-binding protein n=1 Tax=Litorilinea aerophila TaxID=1204385 RepID=A0A540VJA1_9CHLR|nr:ABC transporter ATP-binding protein [Litorilinea aerophila]MCC9076243.1 ABC transporter ATP-binding protein [Litorilinea aerophila]